MSIRSKMALVAATALSLSLSAGTAAGAAAPAADRAAGPTYVALTGGSTTLTLDPGTAQALTDNGIAVAPVGEATAGPDGVAFPVQGGLLNAKTLAGKVTHNGGLTFSAGDKSITIRDFTINTKAATLTAWVDEVGARITVLDLDLGKVKVTVTKKQVTVAKVKALLDPGAADALNGYFSTTLFTGGLKVGTAVVSANSKVLHG